jgi:hypothetical protein
MSLILAAMLVFVVSVALVMMGGVWLARTMLARAIGKRHEALDAIMRTGAPPAEWQALPAGRVERELDRLASYVRKSRLIDGEETRRELIERLMQAKAAGRG